MATYDWRDLLTRFSRVLLAVPEYRDRLPPEVVTSGWLGYPGATEAQLAATETRLGTPLPPAYRQFLAATNGWRMTGSFIEQLWSTEEVAWFRERNADWIDAFVRAGGPPISAAEHQVYGPQQDAARFRMAYLPATLEISAEGDEAIYLLNPEVVTPDGEWEAWFFANWLPGATRYRSFWELMQAEYERCRAS